MDVWPVRFACAALLCVAVSGCFPSGRSQLEEEKEPHFLVGKSRQNAMDYKGAVEAFEKALEVNPQSASAHFELGLLYEKNELDHAAAIYHFERFLKLRPKSEHREIVKQRILACKQQLAQAVLPLPTTPSIQREVEKLAAENARLNEQLEQLRAAYANRTVAPTNPPGIALQNQARLTPTASIQATSLVQRVSLSPAPPRNQASTTNNPSRTYTVKAGDSPYSIARKHGVPLDALLAANPRLDARRMQVGQTVAVPSL